MFKQIIWLTLIAATLILADDIDDYDVEKLFKDTKIVPDVVDTAPKEKLKMVFENDLIVGDGKEFTPFQTKDAPSIDWSADPNSYYTLYMSCPDAPDSKNSTWAEFLHWLVVNIPGKDIDKGELYREYFGPASPQSAGMMRYVFLVYKQQGKQQFDEPQLYKNKLKNYRNFNLRKFAEKYNLGAPVAGNIYRAQWDEYIPIMHEKMGMMDE